MNEMEPGKQLPAQGNKYCTQRRCQRKRGKTDGAHTMAGRLVYASESSKKKVELGPLKKEKVGTLQTPSVGNPSTSQTLKMP